MIRATLACDGREGMYPCRQAAPVGTPSSGADARRVGAAVHGWTHQVADGQVLDFCPACTRRRAEGVTRRRPRPPLPAALSQLPAEPTSTVRLTPLAELLANVPAPTAPRGGIRYGGYHFAGRTDTAVAAWQAEDDAQPVATMRMVQRPDGGLDVAPTLPAVDLWRAP